MPKEDTSWSWSDLDQTTRAVLVLIIVAAIILMVLLLPAPLARWDAGTQVPPEQINATRRTLVQLLGGFAVLAGLWLTARRIRASERRAEALQDQIRVTEQGQVTERFTRAIDQLGSDTLQIRLGGIYSLERIAKDSADDHWTVMEILCSFIRRESGKAEYSDEKASRPSIGLSSLDLHPPPQDVLSALQVVLRRDRKNDSDNDLLDLSDSKLRSLSISNSDLSSIDLNNSDLRFSNLDACIFHDCNLWSTDLSGSQLVDSSFRGSCLLATRFHEANLRKACLEETSDIRPEQLCTAETLHGAKLDPSLEAAVREQCPELLEPPAEK